MGSITIIFVTLIVYLSIKGRLGTYIALATTAAPDTSPKTGVGNQQPNEAGKGDMLPGAGSSKAPPSPPSPAAGTNQSPGDPTPTFNIPIPSPIQTLNNTVWMSNIFAPFSADVTMPGSPK